MKKETNQIKGKLIAVEGLDGSGKSTQIHLVHQWLVGLGCRLFFTEWNSSDLVKEATKKGKKRQLLTPTTFSLIHATDFADRYERQILPMLKGGYIVLCDRYIFTSFARDGVRGCDGGWLKKLYGFAAIPDATLYFRVPLPEALARIMSGRPNLKYFEAGMDMKYSDDINQSFEIFQGKIMGKYDQMVTEYGFRVIDATRNIPSQQDEVRKYIAGKIDLAQYMKKDGR
ncbi:MAG TPA: thymidylate kinase [Candidatus Omnitrophota bacterium]|nr:thymidylate kinase [Candidatus Omnitrophota bacterium]